MTVAVILLIVALIVLALVVMRSSGGSTPVHTGDLTPDLIDWSAMRDDDLLSYLPDRKINAIKRYRELTRVGLKEAKYAVEYAIANPDKLGKIKSASERGPVDTGGAGVRDLIRAGKLDDAVAVYADFMGVDQYTARDAVVAIADEMLDDDEDTGQQHQR